MHFPHLCSRRLAAMLRCMSGSRPGRSVSVTWLAPHCAAASPARPVPAPSSKQLRPSHSPLAAAGTSGFGEGRKTSLQLT